MLDSVELMSRLLGALPATRYVQLLPWHFTALLIALGVLSAIGVHHLIGWTFGVYLAGGFRLRAGAAATLAVLLVSIQALLLAYVLRTQADQLVRRLLTPEDAVQPATVLGSILLDPAFSGEELDQETHVAKDRLAGVIVAMDDEDFHAGIETFLVSPGKLAMATPTTAKGGTDASQPPSSSQPAPPSQTIPPSGPGTKPEAKAQAPAASAVFTNRNDLISAIIVQIGLRWVLDPSQTWPQAMPAGTGSTVEQHLRLPEFALALIDEIQDDAVLDRLDWEHVAGTRFVQAVLQPVLLDQVGRSAGLLAVCVIALDLAYFAVAARVLGRMSGRRKTVPPEAKDAAV